MKGKCVMTKHSGKYVTYLRVSTTKQGADGNGIKAQRDSCSQFLNGGTGDIIAEFVETESGRKARRPQLELALEMCQKNKATLLVARIDRLARNVSFVSRLMNSKIKFVACDMPEANEFTIHIMAAMAEQYSRSISEATKRGLAVVIKKRRKVGNLKKLGSENFTTVQKAGAAARLANTEKYCEKTYPQVVRIRDTWGIKTLRGIAAELTAMGIETPARQNKIDKEIAVFGKPKWGPEQVKLIIDRIEGGRT
jgi:DNA invertase Pin-like site-specific DNA recombinase